MRKPGATSCRPCPNRCGAITKGRCRSNCARSNIRIISAGSLRATASMSGFAPTEACRTIRSIHRCALAYASDLTLLDSALVPLGRTLFEPAFMGASLDHALWLHRPFRADEWLLYSQDSPNLHGSRGLSRGTDLPPGRHPGRLGDAGRSGPAAPLNDFLLHIPRAACASLKSSGPQQTTAILPGRLRNHETRHCHHQTVQARRGP